LLTIPRSLAAAVALLALLAGCRRESSERVQGYVEGEYVYVASPHAGALETLHVQRGAQVNKGDPLFALDSAVEKAALNEAKRRLDQARANLEDAKKGMRQTEMDAIEAQLEQAAPSSRCCRRRISRCAPSCPRHAWGRSMRATRRMSWWMASAQNLPGR